MLLSDLFEAYRLPLIGGGIPNARGSYGAFLVTMNPDDFLKLTTSPRDLERILATPFPLDKDEYTQTHSYNNGANYGRFPLPFLKVIFPSGKITGHEGRHRAAMIMRKGGDRIPVIIYPYEDLGWEAKYQYWSDEDEGFVDVTTGPHASEQEARDSASADLLKYPEEDRGSRIKALPHGSVQLKGSPSRSNRKEYCWAAWEKEDFPNQLVGQYDQSVVVGSDRINIGKIKGYRHYRC